MAAIAIFERLNALADPTRGRLLLALEGHELTVRELQEVLQLPQSTVSRHLKVLAELGLVATRSEGTSNWYRMPGHELAPAARRLWTAVREELAESPAAQRDRARLRPVLARRHLTSQRFFAASAGQWDKLRAELFGEHAGLMALPALWGGEESWTVGDLGCGTGHLIPVLAPFVRKLIGVDESEAMLAAARERALELGNVELRAGSLEEPPLRRGELDAALLLLVLHHAPDPGRVLDATLKTLKPRGRLLLVDMLPHEHVEYREQMGHQWLGFSQPELMGWLQKAGFERARWIPLAPDPKARGPGLFALTAAKPADRSALTVLPSRGLT